MPGGQAAGVQVQRQVVPTQARGRGHPAQAAARTGDTGIPPRAHAYIRVCLAAGVA